MAVSELTDFIYIWNTENKQAFLRACMNPVLVSLASLTGPAGPRQFSTNVVDIKSIEAPHPETEIPNLVYSVEKKPNSAFSKIISVGRTSNADIYLPYTDISKFHAFFTIKSDGTVTLCDAGSTNGTTVRGIPLVPNQPLPIEDGTTVGFANTSFLFFSPEAFYHYLGKYISP